MKPD
jgi:chromosome segregation ATPase